MKKMCEELEEGRVGDVWGLGVLREMGCGASYLVCLDVFVSWPLASRWMIALN